MDSDSENASSDDSANKGSAYSSVNVAALPLNEASSHRLAEFGHMKQFFGSTRWASNDTFVAKTLLDPGASINIVSPYFASRSCVHREPVHCSIFQGTKKQLSFSEFVLCNFELLNKKNEWQRHTEWFAVAELGYEALLGRKFCKEQGFTSFDDKLIEWVESTKFIKVDSDDDI